MTARRDRMREIDETEMRIEDAVFELMKTTDIPDIKVSDVIGIAGVSRSTFYRHFRNVDEVVKLFEASLLDIMRTINKGALKGRFGRAELEPTHSMISRMEVLKEYREKILSLNSDHGDPTFTHKATVFMHEYFRFRLRDVPGTDVQKDLYLSFVIAGHNNLIQYWLEERPDIDPYEIAAVLNRLYYSAFFLNEETAREFPQNPMTGVV